MQTIFLAKMNLHALSQRVLKKEAAVFANTPA